MPASAVALMAPALCLCTPAHVLDPESFMLQGRAY